MKVITYQIHLDEPALFASLEGDPNSGVSYPYIPGSVIRGMIIGLFLKQNNNTVDIATDKACQRRFFSANTRYLNAYPVIKGERSLPAPATWAIPKYKKHHNETRYITDSLFRPEHEDESEKRKPKNVSGFVHIEGNTAHVFSPEMEVNVHTQRARRDPLEQQVFRYESLPDGLIFSGAILFDEVIDENDNNLGEMDANLILALLSENPQIVLGGSRSAGYGRASIKKLDTHSDWQEVPDTKGDDLILTFLSDTILKDENGVYMPTPAVLEKILGCTVTAHSIKTTWVGGFNRKWGLPLPQTIAIERGSVVQLSGIAPNDAKLQDIIKTGIGERREDGFGRVVIGWQWEREDLKYEKYKLKPEYKEKPLEGEAKDLWDRVKNRIRDRQLEEHMSGVLYDKNYTIYGNISRTQISRLRTEIANELRKDEPQRNVLSSFINQISGKNAARQFDNARLGQQGSLSAWLKNPIFGEYGKGINKNDRYVLLLVDMILERAYRERDKRAVGQGGN